MPTIEKINCEEVFNLLRQYYHQRVCRYCEIFLGEVEEAIEHGDYDSDDYRETLSEIAGNACIYTGDNVLTLAASNNENAYFNNYDPAGVIGEGMIHFDYLAQAAFEADILETLGRAGFDWDDAGSVGKALKWIQD